MSIEIKLFAVAKQIAGTDSITVTLAPHATIGQLRLCLQRQFPELQSLLSQLRFAVNADYANDATVIPPDAEVACIPPVSGG